jgi:branched-chain amino acid transport system permease protein
MMAIIGGLGYLWGGLAGAFIFLGLEEFLSTQTKHWQFLLGITIILIVLYAPKGVVGSVSKRLKL